MSSQVELIGSPGSGIFASRPGAKGVIAPQATMLAHAGAVVLKTEVGPHPLELGTTLDTLTC